MIDRGSGGAALLVAISMAFLVGCGSTEFPTAKVSGKVTADGKAVDGGTIMFTPVGTGGGQAGKSADGEIKTDGAYALSTFGTNDGAVIGKHTVVFTPPTVEPPGPLQPGESGPQSPFNGMVPKQREVEVKAGSNEINIELIVDPNPPPPPM